MTKRQPAMTWHPAAEAFPMNNAQRTMDALAVTQEEFSRLWPKWKDPGVTKQEAVDWWNEANDGDE